MEPGERRWSAALGVCAGDQWSLIFPERLQLHFLRGRRIADPSTGHLSGSNKQGFLFGPHSTSRPVVQLQAELKQDGVHASSH